MGYPPLVRCHRQHDRLDPRELLLVQVEALQLLAHPWNELEHTLERAHPSDHPVLARKSSRWLARADALLHLRLLVLLDRGLRLLDQREDVAHAENPRRDTVGVEVLELVELLADQTSFTGRPVTARTDRAAPPRASPSSFVRITPSKATRSWKASATSTASWPVIASSTRSTFVGFVSAATR